MKKKDQLITSKGSSTRDRIVEAARKQLVEKGYDQFVMRELADMLGIKLGNLQYYFKTREALILHVIEAESARDVLTIQAHQQSGDTAEEVFRAIVKDLVARWRGDSGLLFSTMGTLSLHNKAYRRVYLNVYANFYQALEGPLRNINPKISDEEVALRVRLITALIDGSPMQTGTANVQNFLNRVQAQAEIIALT
ncbi:MAG: TetR/AcrR family transcriptional regulator [Oceanicoccus sp.]